MNINGIYLINKPTGVTSHDVIDYLRGLTNERRIGHAGTLDPAASGLMIVAVGREYTKELDKYLGLDKEYEAEIILGEVSTTFDSEGEIKKLSDYQPSQAEVRATLEKLTGTYEQMPPIFSAKKIGGRKAYELARLGKEVVLKPKLITVHFIKLLDYSYPKLKIATKVSSGTYIRSLAAKIGDLLTTGAYLKALVRTEIGDFKLENAGTLNELKIITDLEKFKVK